MIAHRLYVFLLFQQLTVPEIIFLAMKAVHQSGQVYSLVEANVDYLDR